MKAPFYIVDNARRLVFGQFFKLESAEEVQAIIKHASISQSARLVHSGQEWEVKHIDHLLSSQGFRKGTEADLIEMQSIKYFKRTDSRAMGVGHVVEGQRIAQQMVVIRLITGGRKWNTWEMRGLSDGKLYTRKCFVGTDDSKFIRMATPNELHGARQKSNALTEVKQERRETNQTHTAALKIQPGDVIVMNWSDVGERAEVVEDVNWKDGRIALRRRGYAAMLRQKRRFVSAVNVVSIKEKGPGYYRASNPMYAQYGF